MGNLEFRKEILLMKIALRRKTIENLQALLHAYRMVENMDSVLKGHELNIKLEERESKIAYVINRIDFNLERLAIFEAELAHLEDVINNKLKFLK